MDVVPRARVNGERQQRAARDSGVRIQALAAATDGGVFVAGTAWGEISIAPKISFHEAPGDRVRIEHAFLLRLDRSGRTAWAKDLGTRGVEAPDVAPPGGVTALAVIPDLASSGGSITSSREAVEATCTPAGRASFRTAWAACSSARRMPTTTPALRRRRQACRGGRASSRALTETRERCGRRPSAQRIVPSRSPRFPVVGWP